MAPAPAPEAELAAAAWDFVTSDEASWNALSTSDFCDRANRLLDMGQMFERQPSYLNHTLKMRLHLVLATHWLERFVEEPGQRDPALGALGNRLASTPWRWGELASILRQNHPAEREFQNPLQDLAALWTELGEDGDWLFVVPGVPPGGLKTMLAEPRPALLIALCVSDAMLEQVYIPAALEYWRLAENPSREDSYETIRSVLVGNGITGRSELGAFIGFAQDDAAALKNAFRVSGNHLLRTLDTWGKGGMDSASPPLSETPTSSP